MKVGKLPVRGGGDSPDDFLPRHQTLTPKQVKAHYLLATGLTHTEKLEDAEREFAVAAELSNTR